LLATADREPRFVSDVTNFVELLRARATCQSDRIAFEYLRADGIRGRTLTYAALDLAARAVSRLLLEAGLSGQHIMVAYPNSLEYVTALFGCFYAGVTAIPFYPARGSNMISRFDSICADAGVKAVLAGPVFSNELRAHSVGRSGAGGVKWLETTLAPRWLPDVYSDDSIFVQAQAVIQYSSGSTDAPKGVVLTHANLWHNEQVIQRAFGVTENSVVVNWVPLHHDMGLVGGILHSIFAGARCLLMSPATMLQQPVRWLRIISNHRHVVSGGPNAVYDLCVDRVRPEDRAGLDLSGWEIAFNGSEPVRWETLERFSEAYRPYGFRAEAFRPCYGLAEATLMVTAKSDASAPIHCRGEDGHRIVSCGVTDPDEIVVVVDPRNRQPVPAGTIGEIWVAGPSVAQGYWNRPVETERTFHAELAESSERRFLRTGDLGFLAGSQLFVSGRIKDLIIVNGQNVYPQDVEYVVAESHASLCRNAGAFFSVELHGQQRLVLVHEVEHALSANQVNEVIGSIRRAVTAKTNLIVDGVALVNRGAIPRTTSGKIRRNACRSSFLNGSLELIGGWGLPGRAPWGASGQQSRRERDHQTDVIRQGPILSSRTPEDLEKWLTHWLVREARIPADLVRSNCPFADFGLDSATAIMLVSDLEDFLGHRFDATLVWDYPTIGALTAYLANGAQHDGSASRSD
jgi:acyl-CoA synthetase (AMP-forming)/AMP-acid ligase II/acyl carrier protein